jgi:hypothetical protein
MEVALLVVSPCSCGDDVWSVADAAAIEHDTVADNHFLQQTLSSA